MYKESSNVCIKPLNWGPKPVAAAAALPKSVAAVTKCLSRFRHLARLFLNQILILGSVSEVHMAMSSLVLISGYLFLAKSASNSCSCCEVKCVLCLLWRLSLTLFLLLLALMSFVSSSWLSGLTGLWLGSSEAGSLLIFTVELGTLFVVELGE